MRFVVVRCRCHVPRCYGRHVVTRLVVRPTNNKCSFLYGGWNCTRHGGTGTGNAVETCGGKVIKAMFHHISARHPVRSCSLHLLLPPCQTPDRRRVTHLDTYPEACAAPKSPIPDSPLAPRPRPLPLHYDHCIHAISAHLYHSRSSPQRLRRSKKRRSNPAIVQLGCCRQSHNICAHTTAATPNRVRPPVIASPSFRHVRTWPDSWQQ